MPVSIMNSQTGALRGICEDVARELDTTYIKVKMEVWENRITTSPESASAVASNIFTLFANDRYLLKLLSQQKTY